MGDSDEASAEAPAKVPASGSAGPPVKWLAYGGAVLAAVAYVLAQFDAVIVGWERVTVRLCDSAKLLCPSDCTFGAGKLIRDADCYVACVHANVTRDEHDREALAKCIESKKPKPPEPTSAPQPTVAGAQAKPTPVVPLTKPKPPPPPAEPEPAPLCDTSNLYNDVRNVMDNCRPHKDQEAPWTVTLDYKGSSVTAKVSSTSASVERCANLIQLNPRITGRKAKCRYVVTSSGAEDEMR